MSAPHDPPSMNEIVRAVRDWIDLDLSPEIEGRTRFHARVAVNMLDIVLREMEVGPAQERTHADTMAALGVEGDEELAARIRDGEFDGRLAELLAALRPVVEDKVQVANPGHLR